MIQEWAIPRQGESATNLYRAKIRPVQFKTVYKTLFLIDYKVCMFT